jgi:shikimate kinase
MKIFLIGMMGSGKSYWMDKLGQKLKLHRYDLDQLVEEDEGRSIREIFEESGEDHFRKIESAILKRFSDKDDFILATGGGAPCYFDNMEWMNKEGITIWLDEDTDALVERLIPEKAHRPLISHLDNDQLKKYLEQKKEERKRFYSRAKFTLTGEAINEKNMLSLIKENDHA